VDFVCVIFIFETLLVNYSQLITVVISCTYQKIIAKRGKPFIHEKF